MFTAMCGLCSYLEYQLMSDDKICQNINEEICT